MIASPGRRRLIWIALAVYWLGLFVATHLPPRHVPPIPVNDKIEHVGGFTILAMLLSILIDRRSATRAFLIVVGICLIYGALDEWTQPFVGRSCDLRDWLADSCGAIVGSLFGLLITRRFSPFAGVRFER